MRFLRESVIVAFWQGMSLKSQTNKSRIKRVLRST